MAKTRAQKKAETISRWERLLEKQKRSGLSVEAFCRNEGFSTPTFYNWRRKLGAKEVVPVAEVVQVEVPSSESTIELQLPNGSLVRVPESISERTLRSVLGLVASAPSEGRGAC